MATTQEKQVISEFIELYRDLPCLWDLSSETYKDTGQKKVGWEILTEKLKEIEPAANEITAKKKIDNLKYAYQRELKKESNLPLQRLCMGTQSLQRQWLPTVRLMQVKESKRTGSATSEIYKPNLWYYDMMTFLEKKNQTQRSGVDSLMEEDEVEPRKRKRRGLNEDILEAKKDKLLETAQALLNSKDNEANSFGTYVGQKLEHTESGQREIAEKLISEVLFLAKTNNLRFDSRIDTPSISRLPHYNPNLPHSSSESTENSNTNIYKSPPYNQFSHQTDQRRFSSFSPQTIKVVSSPNVGFPIQIQSFPSSSHIHTPYTSPSSNSSRNIERPPCSLSQYTQHSPIYHSSQIAQPNVLSAANSPHTQLPSPQSPHVQHPQQSPAQDSSQIFDNQVVMYAEGPAGEILQEMLIFRK